MSKSRETFNLGSSETVVPEGVVLWGVGGATPPQAENHEFTGKFGYGPGTKTDYLAFCT